MTGCSKGTGSPCCRKSDGAQETQGRKLCQVGGKEVWEGRCWGWCRTAPVEWPASGWLSELDRRGGSRILERPPGVRRRCLGAANRA